MISVPELWKTMNIIYDLNYIYIYINKTKTTNQTKKKNFARYFGIQDSCYHDLYHQQILSTSFDFLT